jgi:malonyl CoA-acyl carrier protein transacylase
MMSNTQTSAVHPLMNAMAESAAVLADGARAEIEAAVTFVQAQAAAMSAAFAMPPTSPTVHMTQVRTFWADALEAAAASAARVGEVVAKASMPIAKILRPAA